MLTREAEEEKARLQFILNPGTPTYLIFLN